MLLRKQSDARGENTKSSGEEKHLTLDTVAGSFDDKNGGRERDRPVVSLLTEDRIRVTIEKPFLNQDQSERTRRSDTYGIAIRPWSYLEKKKKETHKKIHSNDTSTYTSSLFSRFLFKLSQINRERESQ
jgi:hypothetical protein